MTETIRQQLRTWRAGLSAPAAPAPSAGSISWPQLPVVGGQEWLSCGLGSGDAIGRGTAPSLMSVSRELTEDGALCSGGIDDALLILGRLKAARFLVIKPESSVCELCCCPKSEKGVSGSPAVVGPDLLSSMEGSPGAVLGDVLLPSWKDVCRDLSAASRVSGRAALSGGFNSPAACDADTGVESAVGSCTLPVGVCILLLP